MQLHELHIHVHVYVTMNIIMYIIHYNYTYVHYGGNFKKKKWKREENSTLEIPQNQFLKLQLGDSIKGSWIVIVAIIPIALRVLIHSLLTTLTTVAMEV